MDDSSHPWTRRFSLLTAITSALLVPWSACGEDGFGESARWLAVSAGDWYTCAIRDDRSMWCWGRNNSGVLGDGTSVTRLHPTQVEGGMAWSHVTAQSATTCGFPVDVDVPWCWGDWDGSYVPAPALDPEIAWSDVMLFDYGVCGIRVDEEGMWCWNDDLRGDLLFPMGGPGWGAYDANTHVCAVRDDGTMWCAGYNSHGQLGDGSTDPATALVQVTGGEAWAAVAVGVEHTCGIDSAGAAWCWGANRNGATGLGHYAPGNQYAPAPVAGDATWKQITAGSQFTCAIRSDDTLWCWGYGYEGQLGQGAERVIAHEPLEVLGGRKWLTVSAGKRHVCAIDERDHLYCWGFNTHGNVGDGTTEPRLAPYRITLGGSGGAN